MRRIVVVAAVAASLVAPPLVAQMPTPRAEDVGTIDGIIKAFYDVISGPAGAPRQWLLEWRPRFCGRRRVR